MKTYYPLVNKRLDPENHQFLMETSLPTPMTARVYVSLPEGMIHRYEANYREFNINDSRLEIWFTNIIELISYFPI